MDLLEITTDADGLEKIKKYLQQKNRLEKIGLSFFLVTGTTNNYALRIKSLSILEKEEFSELVKELSEIYVPLDRPKTDYSKELLYCHCAKPKTDPYEHIKEQMAKGIFNRRKKAELERVK